MNALVVVAAQCIARFVACSNASGGSEAQYIARLRKRQLPDQRVKPHNCDRTKREPSSICKGIVSQLALDTAGHHFGSGGDTEIVALLDGDAHVEVAVEAVGRIEDFLTTAELVDFERPKVGVLFVDHAR